MTAITALSMTMQQEYKNLFFVFLFVFVFYHFHSTEPPPPPPKTSKIQNFAFFQNFHIWFKFLFHHFWTWFWFCNVPWAMSVLGRTKKLTLFWIVKVKITQFVWKKSNKIRSTSPLSIAWRGCCFSTRHRLAATVSCHLCTNCTNDA